MRKIKDLWTVVMCILFLSACGETSSTDIDLAKTVPDPYVVFAEESFGYYAIRDEVDRFSFMLDDVTENMYTIYKATCRDGGWSNVLFDQDGIYFATDDAGEYRLELTTIDDTMTVGVYLNEKG